MNEPYKVRFWMVEMSTGGGTYIVLPGTHHTKEGTERAIPENLKDICRAQEYETGRGINGPERVIGHEC